MCARVDEESENKVGASGLRASAAGEPDAGSGDTMSARERVMVLSSP